MDISNINHVGMAVRDLAAPAPRYEAMGFLSAGIAATLADPEFKARFIDRAGHTGIGSTPAEFVAFIKADFDSKKGLIAAAGVEAE